MKTQNSVSILSKTQTYLQERKRRSQSQPPQKREKFEFLSTSNYFKTSQHKDDDYARKSRDKPSYKNMTKKSATNYKNHKLESDIRNEKQKFAKHWNIDFPKHCSVGYPHAFIQTLV